ncbi:MAG: preprotein translocase subunit YajC [Christensenellaceae bacterium]
MTLFNLLESAVDEVTSSSAQAQATSGGLFGGKGTLIFWGVAIVLLVVYFVMSSRSRKKSMKEVEDRMSKIAVGDKIVTIGFLEGYVAEVLPNGTYVLNTGSEEHPGYVTISQRAIYKFFKPEELVNPEEPFEQTSTEENATETVFKEDVLPQSESAEPVEENTAENNEEKTNE